MNAQCIPAVLLVPLIKSMGSQLTVVDIRLHMQSSGQLSSNLLQVYCKDADFRLQVTLLIILNNVNSNFFHLLSRLLVGP